MLSQLLLFELSLQLWNASGVGGEGRLSWGLILPVTCAWLHIVIINFIEFTSTDQKQILESQLFETMNLLIRMMSW